MTKPKRRDTGSTALVDAVGFYNPNLAKVILRLGLAFCFFYAGVSGLRNPDAWAGYVPSFVTHFISAATAVELGSIFDFVLTAAFLVGKFLKLTSLVAALFLIFVVVTNWRSIPVIFRDLGLAAMAIALIFLD